MPYADARGATIEIVEKRKGPIDDSPAATTVVPDEVRINGQVLLCSADHPIKIHENQIPGGNVVLVTLTLFVKRLVIEAEGDDDQ